MEQDGTEDAALLLAEAMAARLCHDLGGPLGGLCGALEVAAADPALREEALAVAAEGAADLVRTLRLLRAAWGGESGALDAAALLALAAGLPPRVRAGLDGLGTEPLPPPLARLALNLLLLGAEGLPAGGTVRLGREGAGLVARLEGPRARWPDLAGTDAPTPRALLPPLVVRMARDAGLMAEVADGGTLRLLAT